MIEELHGVAHGIVQGVFFRRTVWKHAESLGLSGTVRNLPDGTVEILARGERETLERFVKLVQQEPGSATLTKLETRYSRPKGDYSGFEISH